VTLEPAGERKGIYAVGHRNRLVSHVEPCAPLTRRRKPSAEEIARFARGLILMLLSNSDASTARDLLRGLVFWEKPDSEIRARLSTVSERPIDFQELALDLTGLTVPKDSARAIFAALADHVRELSTALKRPVATRAAALDLLDRLEGHLRNEGLMQESPYESLAQMAYFDFLTGLPNFRSLSERFEIEIKRAARYGRLLSLIMFDLDSFKDINDDFGHLAGNAVLKHVASLLRNFVRETDLAGRYGGDEFMVLLPETPKHIAERLAAEIQALIGATPLRMEGDRLLALTVSLGMASFPRDARTAEALMAEADAAMYNAKRGGRNRVCVSIPRSSAVLSHGPFATKPYQSVHVVGNFNGWDRTAEPMPWDSPKKCFTVELFLAPGNYEYKLLLDQEKITIDPNNPESVYDGFDGRNSVLRVLGRAGGNSG
jgi:diguanylate cyclase (GGDEF)-like protein